MTDEKRPPADPPSDRPDEAASEAIEQLGQEARVERYPRMRKAKDGSNASLDAGIHNINAWRKRHGISVNKLARMAGLAASTLSEILNGKYRGNIPPALEKVEAAITAWFDQNSGRYGAGFVQTRVAKEILTVLKATNKNRGIGVIIGDTGFGKSMALRAAVAVDFQNALLVEVNTGSSTPLEFQRAILRALRSGNSNANARSLIRGSSEGVNSKSQAFNHLVASLAGSGRMIIVDEAENLTTDSFNVIRQLHDATGCPVVLAGRPPLLRAIERTMRSAAIGGSLVGRISVRHEIKPKKIDGQDGLWLFSVDEITDMLAKWKVRFHAEANRWICALANISALDGQREAGGLRYAMKVAEMAALLGRGSAVTAELARKANTLLRGADYAELADHLVAGFTKRRRAAG